MAVIESREITSALRVTRVEAGVRRWHYPRHFLIPTNRWLGPSKVRLGALRHENFEIPEMPFVLGRG